MGLDQYAYSRQPALEVSKEWRSHYTLHEWIIDHGGETNAPFQLKKDHIENLEKAIESPQFYVVNGTVPAPETLAELKEQDKDFIEWAKEKLEEGMEVWYDSWA
jgi:hypothetical protein